MKLGLITYNHNHLKTEQLVRRYIEDIRIKEIKLFKDKVNKTFIHGFLQLLSFDHVKNKD